MCYSVVYIFKIKKSSVIYVLQSTLGEMVKPKLIPQFAGSDSASPIFTFRLCKDDLRHLQAACLSVVVLAAAIRALAPEQQAGGGIPLPFWR